MSNPKMSKLFGPRGGRRGGLRFLYFLTGLEIFSNNVLKRRNITREREF